MHDFVERKVGRVLTAIGFALFVILLRVWYLAVVRHDEYSEKARRPQRRTVVEHIGRASIRDRFNLPLAINKTQFNIAVCYAHLRQMPNVKWETDAEGKRIRVPVRAKYIENLAKKLGEELGVDPRKIEDTIHAKASLVPHIPFMIAENISEKLYYRLRLMEKDWPGIVAQRTSLRHYPRDKVACDVLGTMGAISAEEYLKLAEELAELEEYIAKRETGENPFLPKGFSSPIEARERLMDLRQKAYTMRDSVGKSGIEASFDEELRGLSGKKLFEVDVKGNVIRELPAASPPIPGQRVLLTISAELQEYAEQLLAQAEEQRCKAKASLREPWIKGGAIVAMDAKTGEVLALASYPRFNPNDFFPASTPQAKSLQRSKILQWLENEDQIAEIWDGHAPLEKEVFSQKEGYFLERLSLTWPKFLEAVIPGEGELKFFFEKAQNLGTIFERQEKILAERRHQQVFNDDDRTLAIDLCRLVAKSEDFPPRLKAQISEIRCEDFFAERQAYLRLRRKIEGEAKELHNKLLFETWREMHFKSHIKAKRLEEKKEHRYPRPYTDYLEQIKRTMFAEFWQNYHYPLIEALLSDGAGENKIPLFAELKKKVKGWRDGDPALDRLSSRLFPLAPREKRALLKSLRGFHELRSPLLGKYARLRKNGDMQLGKHLAAAFYPLNGYGYGRSQAFRQSTPAGSVFKLAIAYQALLERYEKFREEIDGLSSLNPLTLIDESPQRGTGASVLLGRTLDGKPITRLYKGGRLPRSSHAGIGKVDITGAIEQSSNVYFSILAAEQVSDPSTLAVTAALFGCGEKSGIELPGEISGNLPKDLAEDKAALYAYAIGQHSLVVTPLQIAVMMAALAGEGHVLKPSIVQLKAGREFRENAKELFETPRFAYQEDLALIGIHFPLFTTSTSYQGRAAVSYSPVQLRRSLFLPKEIRDLLLDGMRRVVNGPKGTARPSVIRSICSSPQAYRNYVEIAPHLAGKTGTAEILYKHTIDKGTKAVLRKHTSFAGVSFSKEPTGGTDWNNPELVVVVYLRFADAGKEAAPLCALMIQKWKEICHKYGTTSYIRVRP